MTVALLLFGVGVWVWWGYRVWNVDGWWLVVVLCDALLGPEGSHMFVVCVTLVPPLVPVPAVVGVGVVGGCVV